MSEEKLTALVQKGNNKGCIAFFRGMSETDRRKLAPLCLNLLKQQKNAEGDALVTAEAAILATGTLSDLRVVSWRIVRENDLVFALLEDRRPDWVGEWAEKLLHESFYWNHWGLIRRLSRAGVMPTPRSPNYVLAMISGVTGGRFHRGGTSIEAALKKDPELLDDEVWQLFEYEGGGENSLANWDRFRSDQKWHDALLKLAAAGRLPRKRLLSCSIDALERDFNHYRAKWFATFHDGLKPAAKELRDNAPRYLRLVSSSAPNIAAWAIEIVGRLIKESVYDSPSLISGLQPALTSRQKAISRRAIELLVLAAKSSPAATAEAVRAAVTALGHEAADVQKAALDLIEQHSSAVDAKLASAIASYAPAVAASLRSRMSRWSQGANETSPSQKKPAGDKSREEIKLPKFSGQVKRLLGIDALLANIEAERAEIPATTFDGTDIPRLRGLRRLEPITDLDELIDVCAQVVEDETQIDEVERAMDGLSRLCDQKPGDFARRVGPLAKRATHRLKRDAYPFLGVGPRDDLCGIVYAWTTGEVITWQKKSRDNFSGLSAMVAGEEQWWTEENLLTATGFLSRRSIALAGRVASCKPMVLLSAPTHEGGWIAAKTLVERVNRWSGDAPDPTDVCLAMLRLAPDDREQALSALKKVQLEWESAIQYALGGKPSKFGNTAAFWIAAARARNPWRDDKRVDEAFPNSGPDAGRAATYSMKFKPHRYYVELSVHSEPPAPKSEDPDCATVILHWHHRMEGDLRWKRGGIGGWTFGSAKWTATIWPQARESYFAGALETIAYNLNWSEAMWHNKTVLEPLLDSGTPLGTMGAALVATALAAKEPGEHGLATDIAIRAIEQGRLGSDNLGQAFQQLLPTGLIKPGRWRKTLAEVARTSPVHAMVIQQALQMALRDKPQDMPHDFGKLLDLLFELSVELNQHIADAQCRNFLQQVTSGVAGKIAKKLLQLPESPFSTAMRPVLLEAIQQRAKAHEHLI